MFEVLDGNRIRITQGDAEPAEPADDVNVGDAMICSRHTYPIGYAFFGILSMNRR